jgi:hypothetical protein
MKAVIRHLPSVTPAEEIYEALRDLGFDVMSVKQMTSSRRSLPEAGQMSANVPLPLFLITLPKNEKSQEIFKLTGLCHISMKVQIIQQSDAMLQLPAVRPRMGKLQSTPPMFLVWRRPSPQRMPGKGKRCLNSGMLQL